MSRRRVIGKRYLTTGGLYWCTCSILCVFRPSEASQSLCAVVSARPACIRHSCHMRSGSRLNMFADGIRGAVCPRFRIKSLLVCAYLPILLFSCAWRKQWTHIHLQPSSTTSNTGITQRNMCYQSSSNMTCYCRKSRNHLPGGWHQTVLVLQPHFMASRPAFLEDIGGAWFTLQFYIILSQFLTLEPLSVRKGFCGECRIAILPQFLTIELHFVRNGCHFVAPRQHRPRP